MPVAAGQRLGPYEVQSLIGAGGMGEVYKARDTRLNRTVALKVLPTEHAADPQRRARFEREAQAIAALTHPHICTLHDIGEANGLTYLVMEHLAGDTLAVHLRKGPLPPAQVLTLGAEIAGALAAAHRQGIVHRDLKPSNVMLTKSGVKLLDFGLATWRGHGAQAGATGVVPAATRTDTLTVQGTIVGTLPYMAPEQLEGQDTDARTDVWALGCILYEMCTGRQAFGGTTDASLITAIMSADPPLLTTFQTLMAPALKHVVHQCLAKDPEQRWQSAADVQRELGWLAESSGSAQSVETAPRRVSAETVRRVRLSRWWIVGLIVLGALATAMAGLLIGARWRLLGERPERGAASLRLTIELPPDMPLAPAGLVSPAHDRTALALSPDGSRLAYVALIGGTTQICMRDMRNGAISRLAHTSGGHTPFFSPDGAWMGFFADNKLKKVPSAGGEPTVLADAPNPWGATWGADDTIYFNRSEGEGVYRISAAGGAVQPVIADAEHTGRRRVAQGLMPEFVKEGPGLLLAGIGFIDLRQPVDVRPLLNGERAWYVPSGHLLYSSDGQLRASPFDAATMAPVGDSITLFEDVRTANYAVAQYTVSNDGTVVYVQGRPQGFGSLVWVDRKGVSEPFGLPQAGYKPYAISPDGGRLAYGLGGEIWIWDRLRRSSFRLTPRAVAGGSARYQCPRWTPDGQMVVYEAYEPGKPYRLTAAPVDGSWAPVELWAAQDTVWAYPMGFSPDGHTLSFFTRGTDTSVDLLLLGVTTDGGRPVPNRPEVFLGTRFLEAFGRISPDGRWMLFSSDRSGAYEVWVTTYPRAGPMFQLSVNGGREAMWNPAVPGEVVYVNGRGMYAVDVSRGPDRAGQPQLLFEGAYPDVTGFGYDMAPDGRFLMLENSDILRPVTTLAVVTNVFDELRRRMPRSKR